MSPHTSARRLYGGHELEGWDVEVAAEPRRMTDHRLATGHRERQPSVVGLVELPARGLVLEPVVVLAQAAEVVVRGRAVGPLPPVVEVARPRPRLGSPGKRQRRSRSRTKRSSSAPGVYPSVSGGGPRPAPRRIPVASVSATRLPRSLSTTATRGRWASPVPLRSRTPISAPTSSRPRSSPSVQVPSRTACLAPANPSRTAASFRARASVNHSLSVRSSTGVGSGPVATRDGPDSVSGSVEEASAADAPSVSGIGAASSGRSATSGAGRGIRPNAYPSSRTRSAGTSIPST